MFMDSGEVDVHLFVSFFCNCGIFVVGYSSGSCIGDKNDGIYWIEEMGDFFLTVVKIAAAMQG